MTPVENISERNRNESGGKISKKAEVISVPPKVLDNSIRDDKRQDEAGRLPCPGGTIEDCEIKVKTKEVQTSDTSELSDEILENEDGNDTCTDADKVMALKDGQSKICEENRINDGFVEHGIEQKQIVICNRTCGNGILDSDLTLTMEGSL